MDKHERKKERKTINYGVLEGYKIPSPPTNHMENRVNQCSNFQQRFCNTTSSDPDLNFQTFWLQQQIYSPGSFKRTKFCLEFGQEN